jgi:hypothetical protein
MRVADENVEGESGFGLCVGSEFGRLVIVSRLVATACRRGSAPVAPGRERR